MSYVNLDLQSHRAAAAALDRIPGLKKADCEKLAGKCLQTLGRNGLTALFVVLRADGPAPPPAKGTPKTPDAKSLLAEAIAEQAVNLLVHCELLTADTAPQPAPPLDPVQQRHALVRRSRLRIQRIESLGEDLETLLLAKSLLEGMLTYLRYAGKALPGD